MSLWRLSGIKWKLRMDMAVGYSLRQLLSMLFAHFVFMLIICIWFAFNTHPNMRTFVILHRVLEFLQNGFEFCFCHLHSPDGSGLGNT